MLKYFALLFICLFSLNTMAQEQTDTVIKNELINDGVEAMVASWTIEDVAQQHDIGFDFNQKDAEGNTPLYYALSKNKNLDVAKKMIEFGADVNEPSQNGMIPLNVATSKAHELQLQIMMMETLGINLKDDDVQSVLEEKIFNQMAEMYQMAEMLINAGADVNKQSSLGTPLMNAVTNAWNIDIIELLIKSGADLNLTDSQGRTALFYAFASNNSDIVEALIKSGADTSIVDTNGKRYNEVEHLQKQEKTVQ